MKVVGFVLSPRREGNTEILVREALDAAKEAGAETELWTAAGKIIKHCDGCCACFKTPHECHIKDDMQDVYKKLFEADGLIFGSPTYFWYANSTASAFINRTLRVWWEPGRLKGKVGAAISVTWRRGGINTLQQLVGFMLQHDLTIGYNYDAICVGYAVENWWEGEKGAVKRDERSMTEARTLGKTVVELIEKLKAKR